MTGGRQRRRIVGVMGSGVSSHPDLARPVGRLVATLGCHLLTGGGSGVMEEVSRAFVEAPVREGLCLGIIMGRCQPDGPGAAETYTPAEVNAFVEIPVFTHLPLSGRRGTEPLSRNHINVLTADVLIALPGGAGTRSEVMLRQRYGRPVILFLGSETIDGATAEDLHARFGEQGLLRIARSTDELERLIRETFDPPHDEPPAPPADATAGHRVSQPPARSWDPLGTKYEPPDLHGERVLIIGIGGGSDIISAYAVARLLEKRNPAALIYANTKHGIDRGLERISKHIYRLPPRVRPLQRDESTHGTTKIDRSVPRGDEGCPLVFRLSGDEQRAWDLTAEIDRLRYDRIFAVDTGAGSLFRSRAREHVGRAQRMLAILERCAARLHHVTLGPGCDGDVLFPDLDRSLMKLASEGRYLGCFSLAPVVEVYRRLAGPLSHRRTPNLLLTIFDGKSQPGTLPGTVVVPRGRRPMIPDAWLRHGFVFHLGS